MGAGALALGSKAALMIKSGSGIGGLVKGVGLLAVGGAATSVDTMWHHGEAGGICPSPIYTAVLHVGAQAEQQQQLWEADRHQQHRQHMILLAQEGEQ